MDKLDDKKIIEKIDKSNMNQLLADFSNQFFDTMNLTQNFQIPSAYSRFSFSNVIFCGMGGSGIGACLVKNYLKDEAKIPIYVNRDYDLPQFAGQDSLVIVCSYSGNTEEILSVFNEAQKRKAKIICISSGGKLKKETLKQNLPFLQIPTGLPPRCTLGYSVVFILDIMHKMNIIDRKEKEIEKTGKLLKQMSSDLKVDALNNYAKKIANYLFNKYIVIYGTALTEAAAKRFDNQLSENSKTLSAYNILPELNHNHIESWQNPAHLLQEFAVVILKNNNEPFKFKRRIEATKKIIKKSNIRIIEIEASGENLLSQIFSLIYICDWVSFYLAILNGVDPTPVEKIEYLKEQLKKE